jgi:hypothetical protein
MADQIGRGAGLALPLMKILIVIGILIALGAAYLLLSRSVLVADRCGGPPRVITPQAVSILQVPSIVEQLRAQARDASWAAFAFDPKGEPDSDETTVNLQYSVENGTVGMDWVLLGPRNKADKDKIAAFINQLGHKAVERESNRVKYVRVEDGNISELGVKIMEEIYHLGPSDDMALLTDQFAWKK